MEIVMAGLFCLGLVIGLVAGVALTVYQQDREEAQRELFRRRYGVKR